MARLLAARGFTQREQVEDFLSPTLAKTHDPFLLKGMDQAVDRIGRAIEQREPICVYGDYDVDGITATAVLRSSFAHLSVDVGSYIPHRLKEGYGLNVDALRQLADRGIRLLITVDNGITATEKVDVARSLGIDVIITDHHRPGPAIPSACAIVNPRQPGCAYPFKDLAGVGVSFKLAHALLKRRAPDPEAAQEFLKSLLDFVALGTVADSVPLVDENRCLVSHGLRTLRSTSRPGLKSLMDVIGLKQEETNAERLVFSMAPRLNAAGRTEHADYALDLLMTEDPAQARELAGLLDRFNEERRRIELAITEEAFSMIGDGDTSAIIVIRRDGWHQGVVGIVASRILDRYYRPAIVLGGEGELAKGSARSIRGFDMHGALAACEEHLIEFGGHTMAAGLRLKVSSIDAFRSAINAHARSVMSEQDLLPTLDIDTRAGPEDLTSENIATIDRLEPFGAGNPKPLLAIEGFNLIEEPRTLKGKHLKLHLGEPGGRTMWAIGFWLADRADELRTRHARLRLAATPFINPWGGRNRMELEIKDFIVED